MATKNLVLGAGCFWCVENIFARIKGVNTVVSGYAGGDIDDPSYEQVCSGETNHAEVVNIKFDPAEVSAETLLTVFFNIHDPTSLNRQGEDVGTQYRSTVMYADEDQKVLAQQVADKLAPEFDKPIVTQYEPLTKFYSAEQYHQDYYNNNPNNGYCQLVVAKKIQKFLSKYAHLLKE